MAANKDTHRGSQPDVGGLQPRPRGGLRAGEDLGDDRHVAGRSRWESSSAGGVARKAARWFAGQGL